MPAMRRSTLAVLAASLVLGPESLGRIQLLPAGEFAARDGRPGKGRTWRLTDAQGAALAADLNRVASQTPIVIDYEHHTLTAQQSGHKAIAAGWMQRFEWLDGKGLFADVEWTPAAKGHIDVGEYRYISPVIAFDAAGNVTGLALAALVNYPALVGMDAAMAAALSAFTPPNEQESTVTLLAALIAGLGLKAEATEAEAIAAVAALQAQVKAPPAVPTALSAALKLADGADMTAACSAVTALVATSDSATTTIAALQGQLAALQAKGVGDEVQTLVNTALTEGKLMPAQKDWAINLGRTNVEALKGFLATAPKLAAGSTQTQGDPSKGGDTAALSATQLEVFASFGINADAAKKHLQAQAAA